MTEVSVRGRVGPDVLADGAEAKVRMGRTAEQVITELHGRFYEQTYRGNVFGGGLGLTGINNATYTSSTVGATLTPIIGLRNPPTATVNLVPLYATLSVVITALAATGPGGFVWMTSVGNTAISTGASPLNLKTLVATGSQGFDMSNVAPTGLTNNFAVRFGSAFGGGSGENVSFTATAVAMQTMALAGVETFDGSLIVPPGGMIALVATTTPVAHSVTSSIRWEEVPL